jgi:hypothetical protein
MKKMKTRKVLNSKKMVAMLAAVALIISTVSAQPVSKSCKDLPDEPLSVKYIGADDNYLTFQITITATNAKHSVLHINDASVGSLYAETLQGGSKIQTIKIEKEDNAQNISFELIAGKKTYEKSFVINTSVIEKTTVSEGSIVAR